MRAQERRRDTHSQEHRGVYRNKLARNFFRGPGAWNPDFSVFKHFRAAERVDLRLTADVFNLFLFNHPDDVNPSSGTGLQDLIVQANAPRIIQFSLRVSW